MLGDTTSTTDTFGLVSSDSTPRPVFEDSASMTGDNGLIFGVSTLLADADSPVVGDTSTAIGAGSSMVGEVAPAIGSQRCHTVTSVEDILIEDFVLSIGVGGSVIRDIALTMIVGNLVAEATTLTASSNGLVTGPLALAALMLSYRFFVVCLKNFICKTKHLKMFY